ncbi:MAG: HAMP domain-containing histidine kinase [Clostridiales bacterium]|nr:HAMP domain-containing histidine kinase [Clostridiales bacterium]
MIKNKNKNKRIKGKFSNIIIRNYVVFSVLLVILLFFVLYVTVINLDKFDKNNKLNDLSKVYKETTVSNYGDIDVDPYVGKDGYIDVIDSNLRTVYTSRTGQKSIKYTGALLKIIPYYNTEKYFDSDIIKKGRNKGCVIIYSTTVGMKDTGVDSNTDVVDPDYDNAIVICTVFSDKERYTDTEYAYISKGELNGYKLNKIRFTDTSGNKYTIVSHTKKGVRGGLGKKERIFLAVGIGFACMYILMLILFSLWISRSVRKPLRILEQGMNEVSCGETGKQVQYAGPKEFVDICDNFNAMSTALYKLEKRNQHLQNENQRIISDISHDLKTPITVIQGYTKAISDGMVPPEEKDKYLSIISDKAESLAEQINEIHDYTKLDHPDYSYDMKPVDICEYTREFFARAFDELEIAGYFVDVDIPEMSIMVNLDIGKFNRVYSNLVNNFMKYNKPGKTVYCRIEYDDISVTIKIGDDGIGISKKIKGDIFDPFVMGEKSRSSGGSGLGLAMVNKIVKRHQGTVEVMDKPDKGMKTEFSIRLLRM